jgi:hypothetical protein
LLPVLLLAALACAQPAWQDTGTDLGALKQRFNQDASSPRLLMLVSPT